MSNAAAYALWILCAVLVVACGGDDGSGTGEGRLPPKTELAPERDPASPPMLDLTVATSVYAATSWLLDGVQTDVTPGAVTPANASAIHGVVRGRLAPVTATANGTAITTPTETVPLQGVTISVEGRPELGQTSTRDDGSFDLLLAAGPVTLYITQPGYIPVRRSLELEAGNWIGLDDVVLTAPDPNATQVQLGSNSVQLVRSSLVFDAAGLRQSVMVVRPGTQVRVDYDDGSFNLANTLTFRMTELSAGADAVEALADSLPPEGAVMHSSKLYIDEIQSPHVTKISFSQPMGAFVNNFVGLPVGTRVPLADATSQTE
ncbi:MAG: hypothetical protein ACOC1F_06785, partial [Myxococcota bacterium]